VLPLDLGKPHAIDELAREVPLVAESIDVLVNNAGVLYPGAVTATAPRRHQEMIDLNVGALTALLAQFVPPMCRRGHGRVLNVASIAAFQPVPRLSTYAATKAYVLSLSECLAEELRGSGVTVTALCPGFTATHMLDSATAADARLAKLPGLLIGDAERVADEGYRACMQGAAICIPGVVNEAMTYASRATPRALLRRLTAVLVRSVS
jgi:short-subunit dehydrogenase